MADQPFAPPAPPGEGIAWPDLLGSLLLINVISAETGIQTSYGAADAIRADVTVLDGPNAGKEHLDTLIFPKVLQSQLRARVGGKVLGRLTQGQAKPGQSAPWLLAEATEQDQQTAMAWLNRQMSAPAQPDPNQQQQPPQAAAQPPQQQAWPQGQPTQQQWPQQQPQGGQGQKVPF